MCFFLQSQSDSKMWENFYGKYDKQPWSVSNQNTENSHKLLSGQNKVNISVVNFEWYITAC
jgi:hypothetical protein